MHWAHLTENHDPSEEVEPKCVNCGQNHRATTRSCPKRAEFILIRKKASTGNQPGCPRKQASANIEEQHPLLQPRRMIPVLQPLPLNQPRRGCPAANTTQLATKQHSVQPYLAAAAASQGPTPISGLSYADVTAGAGSSRSASTDPQRRTALDERAHRNHHHCHKHQAQLYDLQPATRCFRRSYQWIVNRSTSSTGTLVLSETSK